VTGQRVAVLGAGSWGTAFGAVLVDAGNDVTLWARRPELAAGINDRHVNERYLPGITLPDGLRSTADAGEALDGASLVVLAVPSQTLRENLSGWVAQIPPDCVLVSLMKGIELRTSQRMSEVICEVADVPTDRVAVVSGPNLAKEIAQRQPAASVVACVDEGVAEQLQGACFTKYFRPYTNTDVVGCELGGTVKNVIALAVGMAAGMGFGDNAKASLITRGLTETARLGHALGADAATFSGLAGLGDLVATCASPLSRNRTFGERLGRGESLEDIAATTTEVAEGVKSCQSVLDLARKYDVDMPITEHVASVVHDGMSPTEMVRSLMSRDAKAERPVGL
jgi:glycerol-3-phosphate dehydrogenase (NAD(P)+)